MKEMVISYLLDLKDVLFDLGKAEYDEAIDEVVSAIDEYMDDDHE